MSARIVLQLEQFVSPAEIRRALRCEERGLGSASVHLTDLVLARYDRLTGRR
jgi:hypothetical protein